MCFANTRIRQVGIRFAPLSIACYRCVVGSWNRVRRTKIAGAVLIGALAFGCGFFVRPSSKSGTGSGGVAAEPARAEVASNEVVAFQDPIDPSVSAAVAAELIQLSGSGRFAFLLESVSKLTAADIEMLAQQLLVRGAEARIENGREWGNVAFVLMARWGELDPAGVEHFAVRNFYGEWRGHREWAGVNLRSAMKKALAAEPYTGFPVTPESPTTLNGDLVRWAEEEPCEAAQWLLASEWKGAGSDSANEAERLHNQEIEDVYDALEYRELEARMEIAARFGRADWIFRIVMERRYHDGAETIAWLEDIHDAADPKVEIAGTIWEPAIENWHAQDPSAVYSWVETYEDPMLRDEAVSTIAFRLIMAPERDFSGALEMIEKLGDAGQRAELKDLSDRERHHLGLGDTIGEGTVK